MLGVSPTGAPRIGPDHAARASRPWASEAGLPTMTSSDLSRTGGIGLIPDRGHRGPLPMEECCGCYGNRAAAFDPIVGVRRPERTVEPLARVVGSQLQLEYFDQTEVSPP